MEVQRGDKGKLALDGMKNEIISKYPIADENTDAAEQFFEDLSDVT